MPIHDNDLVYRRDDDHRPYPEVVKENNKLLKILIEEVRELKLMIKKENPSITEPTDEDRDFGDMPPINLCGKREEELNAKIENPPPGKTEVVAGTASQSATCEESNRQNVEVSSGTVLVGEGIKVNVMSDEEIAHRIMAGEPIPTPNSSGIEGRKPYPFPWGGTYGGKKETTNADA